jgi:hypothetical protein
MPSSAKYDTQDERKQKVNYISLKERIIKVALITTQPPFQDQRYAAQVCGPSTMSTYSNEGEASYGKTIGTPETGNS